MKKLAVALISGAMLLPLAIAADKDSKKVPPHMDPYVNGNSDENRVAKEVRHQLVMLPYFGVFDDLGFTVNGGTVTLSGR